MDARAWDERYAASDLVWSAGPNQFVAAECADLPPGLALDLAAGEGRNAIWLARRGWQVTALDFSQVALDKGRILAGDLNTDGHIDWVCADATRWRPTTTFDLVVVAYLQLPSPERRAAHRIGFDALAAGGTLLVVGHDTTNLTEGSGGPQDASVLFTADDVLVDLADRDLEVVRAGRVERRVDDGDGHRSEPARTAYDCLVRLRRSP